MNSTRTMITVSLSLFCHLEVLACDEQCGFHVLQLVSMGSV